MQTGVLLRPKKIGLEMQTHIQHSSSTPTKTNKQLDKGVAELEQAYTPKWFCGRLLVVRKAARQPMSTTRSRNDAVSGDGRL